jgi:hypothetical protein
VSAKTATVLIRGGLNDCSMEVVYTGGRSVWLTYLGPQRGRRSTLALDARACRELARVLEQAAEAIEAKS